MRKRSGLRACQLESKESIHMKTPSIENIVVDEVHERTYVVMARRILTDGEVFSAIRVALLKRGGKRLEKGEKLVLTSSLV